MDYETVHTPVLKQCPGKTKNNSVNNAEDILHVSNYRLVCMYSNTHLQAWV